MSYYNITRQPVREYAGGSVGGILRKSGSSTSSNNGVYTSYTPTPSTTGLNAGEARQVDLLVFGYACKLFRDDDKARDIDQGKHMIPWMGDTTLKIDRYDVRGALSELAPHEPPPGGYGNRLDYLSAEEQRAEQLCEEERYLYLYNNEEDHILRQEEDLKRLKQDVEGGSYAQVDFQYGKDGVGAVPHGPNREEHSNSPSGEEAEQAFSLPMGFAVPASILLPETMKQHAIIEKTARFIASQGMQMEILLKAKQSNNVQFEFLAINGALNPYYKFILNAIKNGSYPAERSPTPPNGKHETVTGSSSTAAGDTAHMPTKPIITVPTIKYKPSANCAYTQLISKIKGVPLPAVIDGELANMPTSNSPTPSPAAGANFTPVLLQYNGSTYVSAGPEAEEGTTNSNSNSQSNGNVKTEVKLLMNSSALALAQDYASDTESEAEEQLPKTPPPPKIDPVLDFPVPTETLKNIIDKTATYVIKNGRQFEETLRAKSVDRFTFLLYDNEFYPYYLYKVTDDPDAASKEQKQRKAAAVAAALMSKKGLQSAEKAISPVCFSIKPKEESTGAILQPALPHEPSDDDEEGTAQPAGTAQVRSVPEHVQKAIQLVESQLMARNAQIAATVGSRSAAKAVMAGPAALLGLRAPPNQHQQQSTGNRFDSDYNNSIGGNSTKTQLKSSKAEMERNALFEQQQQNRQKELKKAEEKVKDKLAKIAREKLGGPISKEKQLQLERKRKAMAFLNQIKGDPSSASNANQSNVNAEENASDSEESVHSIPITSYGPEDDGKSDEEKQRLIEIPTTHIAGAKSPPAATSSKGAPKPKSAATVTVSDDDDVQLVGEIKPIPRLTVPKPRPERKRNLRSRQRDSSPDATPVSSSTSRVRKRAHRRRSRSPSQSSDDDDSGSSSDSSSSTSSSSSSSSSDSECTYQSDNSTDAEVAEGSRSHRKHKSSAKAAKKSKTRKSSKSRKSAGRSARKKKSKKRVRSRKDRSIEEYNDYKERERTRARAHKSKRELQQEDEYEHERTGARAHKSKRELQQEDEYERERTQARAHKSKRELELEDEYERERTRARAHKSKRELELEDEYERERTLARAHKSKRELEQENEYEREYKRRERPHRSEGQSHQRNSSPTPADSASQRRRERMQRSASREARRERERELERECARERERGREQEQERDREHREHRRTPRDGKQRGQERDRERDRDRSHTPTPTRRYDTSARKEKKKKHER